MPTDLAYLTYLTNLTYLARLAYIAYLTFLVYLAYIAYLAYPTYRVGDEAVQVNWKENLFVYVNMYFSANVLM